MFFKPLFCCIFQSSARFPFLFFHFFSLYPVDLRTYGLIIGFMVLYVLSSTILPLIFLLTLVILGEVIVTLIVIIIKIINEIKIITVEVNNNIIIILYPVIVNRDWNSPISTFRMKNLKIIIELMLNVWTLDFALKSC